ncbi:hypothetical protein [Neobacillus sp. Marseille-QA0830]
MGVLQMTLLAFVAIIIIITVFIDYAFYLGYKKGDITFKKSILFNVLCSLFAVIVSCILLAFVF